MNFDRARVDGRLGWRTPETYGQAFTELASRGVIDAALADRMAEAAGLRNLLVHEYADIDPARLHASLREDVGHFQAFVRAVLAAMDPPQDG